MLSYNKLVRLRNEVDQGFSSIDVQLKRRADLIPNLVESVKAYAAHEASVFQKVTEARAATLAAATLPAKAAADALMQSAITGLLGIAEAYPELRAVESFKALQAELSDTENKIAAARRYYNNTVRRYNTALQSVPTNVIGGATGFTRREFYRIEDDADREPVAVTFGAVTVQEQIRANQLRTLVVLLGFGALIAALVVAIGARTTPASPAWSASRRSSTGCSRGSSPTDRRAWLGRAPDHPRSSPSCTAVDNAAIGAGLAGPPTSTSSTTPHPTPSPPAATSTRTWRRPPACWTCSTSASSRA